jgi:ABC-type ATPase involved in cell division
MGKGSGMTREEVLKMFCQEIGVTYDDFVLEITEKEAGDLVRFATAIYKRGQERMRERVAKFIEPGEDRIKNPQYYSCGQEGVNLLLDYADAIRELQIEEKLK